MDSESTLQGSTDPQETDALGEAEGCGRLAQSGPPPSLPRGDDGPLAPPLEVLAEDEPRARVTPAQRSGKSALGPVPGHNLDAERSVLGSILIESAMLAEVAGRLQPGDFYLDAHGDIYRAMLSLFAKGAPVDTLTLCDALEGQGTLERVGGLEAITSLASSVPTSANCGYYVGIVHDHAVKRRLVHVGGVVAGLGQDPEVEASDAIDQAERVIFEVSDGATVSTGPRPVGPAARGLLERIRVALATGGGAQMTGLPLGVAAVDLITGGMRPGELTILAARPGMGKSLLAGWSALTMAELGAPVGLISLEMSQEQLEHRWVATLTGIDSHKLDLAVVAEYELAAVEAAVEAFAALPLLVDDTPNQSIMQVRASARRMVASAGIRLLIVDYLGLMRADQHASSRTEEVTLISGALKCLARDLHIPVLAVSQLNRESERRTIHMPQLSDLRDSGSLEQDADVVLFVHRAAEYEEGKDPSAAQIKIAKNRHGPSAIVVPARVDLATGRWSDIDMASSVPAGVRKVFPDARPVANGRANQ